MIDKDRISAYYDKGLEFDRLDQGSFKLEKKRTQQIISRYLKRKKMKILDAGGASGTYSFWLAGLGHEVHLLDLSPANIREAVRRSCSLKRKPASITVGDACRLPFDDKFFDIVLLMGPLYHITERKLRQKALKEAKRVLKKSGVLLAAAISRHSALFGAFCCNNRLLKDPVFIRIMLNDVKTGQHRNRTRKDYFTTAYFHGAKELEREVSSVGFRRIKVLPVEGFGCIVPDFDKAWRSGRLRKIMTDYAAYTEDDESIKGVSAHLMAVGVR